MAPVTLLRMRQKQYAHHYKDLIHRMRRRPEVKRVGDCFPFTPSNVQQRRPEEISTESLEEVQETSDAESSEEEENSTQLNQSSIGNSEWCLCGNCSPMDTAKESTCCH
ncbi:hypothetical protein XELAEV_18041956mg [Xenopus laevis]|uniref:P2X purinoreceptor 7 intracellular domain-containing protein n=1 Tax=Xenopus laevis TaxID=8355 RepID=A0A974H5L3_XENLA|nr:hypothetical protein XELAEV_18041956mg [Xenopus laevis]